MSTPATERHADEGTRSADSYYFVLDDEDRVVQVGPSPATQRDRFAGQVLWSRLPGAEPLLRHHFDEARRTGRALEFVTFYARRVKSIRVVPAADGLAVHVEPLTELDVRTLGTLEQSLREIEAELADRASEQLDSRAPASPQALP